MTASAIASLPSPGAGSFEIGPFEFRAYGLMIALGVLAAVLLSQRRWAQRGGNPEQVIRIAMWAVPAGLVGARLYHVLTDWKQYRDSGWLDAFEIWKGGLGIPGGMALGIAVGLWVMARSGLDRAEMLDVIVPSLPLAQAVGRFGNWFNQELFGGPTELPWGLEIDEAHRPAEHVASETFHPAFLYEALWNLALCGLLVWIDRVRLKRGLVHRLVPPGALLAVYVGGYGIGRLWIEALRIDSASLLVGVRVNIWLSLVLIAGSVAYLALLGLRAKPAPQPAPRSGRPDNA